LSQYLSYVTLTQEVTNMPTKTPRVNLTLEKPLYEALRRLAKRDGVSLSLKARDLVKEALALEEDRLLAQFAETREASFDRSKALTHAQAWTHLEEKRR
jgi:transcriptional antiterminator Rof (Rho-off)